MRIKHRWSSWRRCCEFVLVIAVMVVLFGEVGRADVIDRMMAVVDGRVVTLGDVRRHQDVARMFGDVVAEDEVDLLREVIEDLLIQDQIDQFPGLGVDQQLIDEYVSSLPEATTLTPELIREAAQKRLERINYFDLRFRRFTEATEEEITAYYETVFRPEAMSRGLEAMPALEEVRELIGENVITEKADREISVWTDSLMSRSEIEVVE